MRMRGCVQAPARRLWVTRRSPGEPWPLAPEANMSEARLPIHPYAAIFPAITCPDFDHLCGAIARQGLLQEIILHEGQVLDGWHRYLACLVKQMPPRLRDYAGECGSPLSGQREKHETDGRSAQQAAVLMKVS